MDKEGAGVEPEPREKSAMRFSSGGTRERIKSSPDCAACLSRLVLTIVLRKSVKALQDMVNEVMAWLEQRQVTTSAYSQARYKFNHTAFI